MNLTLILLSVFLLVPSSIVAQSTKRLDFLDWSRDQCQKVLKRHTEDIKISDLHWGVALTGGSGPLVSTETDYFVWLTESAAKAYTRLIQIKAHLSDSEAEEVYRGIRPRDKDHITIALFSRSLELGWKSLAGITVDEGEKPDDLGERKIDLRSILFLVRKKDNEQGARIEEIEKLPDEIIVPTVSRYDTAYGSLIRFSKNTQNGTPLVRNLKDEIMISFYRLGKERKTTFKLKNFRLSSIQEL